MKNYSVAKRFLSAVPTVRERLVSLFLLSPAWMAPFLYRVMRRYVFVDNTERLRVFHAAFEHFQQLRVDQLEYLEFGVARGTSLLSVTQLATQYQITTRFFGFDSFEGLPASEGSFKIGDFAYTKQRCLAFLKHAGADLDRVELVPGFFDTSLTDDTRIGLGLLQRRPRLVHIDSDLYSSAVTVLCWVAPLLARGSIIIFDDWFEFDHEADPTQHGEQRAFAEWGDRRHWELFCAVPNVNVGFIKQ